MGHIPRILLFIGTNAKDARREDHHGACKLGEIMQHLSFWVSGRMRLNG